MKKHEQSDRLMWLLMREIRKGTRGPARRKLVSLACDCVESVQHYVPKKEKRPMRAIEAARRWSKRPTKKNRAAASIAAHAAFAAYKIALAATSTKTPNAARTGSVAYAAYFVARIVNADGLAACMACAANVAYATFAANAADAFFALEAAEAAEAACSDRREQYKKMCDMVCKRATK